jgi:hypothetical protein
MNKLTFICFSILLFVSRTKKSNKINDNLVVDCSNYTGIRDSIFFSGEFCQSDTFQTYFGIRRELFLARNKNSFTNGILVSNEN